jgi:two-component system cell cycle sensor histidine kinase/response regulator CckA
MNLNMKLKGVALAARSWTKDWGGVLTVALALLFICYIVWIFLLHPTEEYKTLVTDIAQPFVSLCMTILAWRASRQQTLNVRKRRAWQIFTVAFLMYFVGNVMWAYYELGVGVDLAVTWADVPYLMYYPICLVGLLSFPLGRSGRSRLTFALDAGTVMLGAAIVIWYLVLRPVALGQHAGSLETAVTLAYPVGNTVLLFGVIAVLLRRPSKMVSGALGILTLAIFFDAIADFGYSYQTLDNVYFGGQWPDCFYMLGFVMTAVSAQYQYRIAKGRKTESPITGVERSRLSWLPYAAVAVAYGLLLYVAFKLEREHGMQPIVWLSLGAFLITTLVVARQIVAVRENSRLLAEKAARESEVRFFSLVQHSSDVIIIIGADGRVTYVSPSTERVFGYEPGQLLGLQLREFFFPDDRQRAIDTIRAIAQEPGQTGSIELRARHRDQSWLHVEAVMTNLLSESNVAGIVINARDVTERKKAEEALHQSEEKLRQSQKMEAVGQLAGGVAHDFNNLLAVIVGYSDMVLRGLPAEGSERTIRHVTEIKKAGDRAASLTRQLLAFSRKQVLQPKVIDLNAVVRDMDKMLRRLIGEHIEMRTVLNAELGSVKADPGQIEQVLLNLAVNARDAMPEGGSLTIETSNVELNGEYAETHRPITPGPYVLIAVSDAGCGMSAELQSRIFEPFFTTKDKGKGTGLGLATVHGIVQQSGGSIWVYSEPGHGTTFKIYLPRLDQSASVVEQSLEKSKDLSGTETVLLVEDEEAVRRLAQEVLQSNGYRVLDAGNGIEAVKLAGQHKGIIDLMVTDVVMPQLGGRELAERLSVTRPEMRVLYMSGYTDDAIVHHGVLNGRAAFLEKPFAADALALKVREVLSVG